ncbi:MAG: Pr6Pr family membrane protein, partial [Actinomycetota bacterium]|nr:Pr6Pr family membrane protein [Actinomycetota bacterium]
GSTPWGLVTVKMLFALLGFSALVTEVATLVERGQFRAGDFFSYFTVESNALSVISLVVSSFVVAVGHRSARLDYLRGAVALFMTTTIIIFIVLLSGYPASELTAVPWDNTVLHYIMPIAIILDWLFATRVEPVPYRKALLWLVFPLAYLLYSLVRGPIANWYPYPFMDASKNGYGVVVVTSLVIAVVLAAITWVVGAAPRWTGRLSVAGVAGR